jgi:hypothetical protein
MITYEKWRRKKSEILVGIGKAVNHKSLFKAAGFPADVRAKYIVILIIVGVSMTQNFRIEENKIKPFR